MTTNHFKIQGLTSEQVAASRAKYGLNQLHFKNENSFLIAVKRIAMDPMVIMLLVASLIYFVSGKMGDGIFLAVAIAFQTSISLFQYSRSKKALEKLKEFSQPRCKVYRNGKLEEIESKNLVMGDFLMVEEGMAITADGNIVHSNDFSVNESILTGESFAILKDKEKEDHVIYSGTTVISGLAIVEVTAIGNDTRLGKIGKSLESITEERTPLEKQISNFVRKMAIAGAAVFVIVWIINFLQSRDIIQSLLRSLTLAMSILPEEIPVAFTTFMALGAWRLMNDGVVVKQMKTVETLGSATVICIDKTGTITENKMSLARLYVLRTNEMFNPDDTLKESEKSLLKMAMLASEPIPFDPMEVALHQAYVKQYERDERPNYKLVHEYPLSGKPPMMTHVFEGGHDGRIIAAKGAPEALIHVSQLDHAEKLQIKTAITQLTNEGYRVLGIGVANLEGENYPAKQQDLSFEFLGIVAFYDPPKKNIQKVLEGFYNAGIQVKIITGDNAATTQNIAKQIGFRGYEKTISGDKLMAMSDDEFQKTVSNDMLFTRMFPEAKLRIINALKLDNQIVAMTGDGVNDGPALKAAHIGIAMGKKGTEMAKQAASLILLEDDLAKMVDAIAMGRRIYANLKKAIQYIISIHIPIILTVFIPLALGWIYPNIFSPLHIIFLEIIMGPTCSIVYENEPLEKNAMQQMPKAMTTTFFNWNELSLSIVQGLVITIATLFIYQYSVHYGYSEALTRTMVFTVLITANIFLTLVNRSFYYSIFTTMKYKNDLILWIILITVVIVALILYVRPISAFFEFEFLGLSQVLMCIAIGISSVIWFEVVKWLRRLKKVK